jgi:hypothetical protein
MCRLCESVCGENGLSRCIGWGGEDPLPPIRSVLDWIGNALYITRIDLRAGYHQLRLDPGSIAKTAFICTQGVFEWIVLPFGLKNGVAVFQRFIRAVLL